MDALLPPLVVAFLAEFGDKTQLLAILLAARFPRHGAVIGGIVVAALINSVAAAIGGAAIAAMITHRAIALLLAVALLGIALGNFWPVKAKDTASDWKLGAFATSAVAFLILEFGDKTQLAMAGFAARGHAPALTAIGATIGVVAANVPAVLLGRRFPRLVPVRAIRIGVGVVLLVVALWVGLDALRLT